MQDQIPIENTGSVDKNVAGRRIPPGEVRFFKRSELPAHIKKSLEPSTAEPAEKPDNDAHLRELLEGSVKAVTAELHTLTDSELEKLAVIEGMDKARTTLLTAVNEEQLRRADLKSDDGLTGVERYVQLHHVG